MIYEIAHGEGWVEFHWDDIQGIEFVHWSSSIIGPLRFIKVFLNNGARFELHPKYVQEFRDFTKQKKHPEEVVF